MARLTQTQLTGFRIGATPIIEPDSEKPGDRRPDTRGVPGAHQLRPPAPAGIGERDAASRLGPVPPAPRPTEARHKIGLTLPLGTAERVRALTRQGYALADLVMVAYQTHRDQLLDEHHTARPRGLVPHPKGRSPVTVALSRAERAALDALAQRLCWSRSHTVAVLLKHQLESMP